MSDRSVVIVGAKRTPIGSFQGQFAACSAVDLGAAAIADQAYAEETWRRVRAARRCRRRCCRGHP